MDRFHFVIPNKQVDPDKLYCFENIATHYKQQYYNNQISWEIYNNKIDELWDKLYFNEQNGWIGE